jgi:hypothetical protein
MFHTRIIQQLAIGFALTTTFGVLVHDTKIDQATSVALTLPVALVGFELSSQIPKLSSEGHTHVERVSLSNAIRDLHAGTPRVQPRDEHKKYHLQKHVVRGVHAFDGYYLPLSEV